MDEPTFGEKLNLIRERTPRWTRDENRNDVQEGNVWPGPCANPECQLCGPPLTELERDLLGSLNFAFGVAEGRIVDARGRWT